MFKIDLI